MANCFLYDKCNHKDCDKPFCRRRYMLEVLYKHARIPEQSWPHLVLRTDGDGTDLTEFQRLAGIEQDIENFVSQGKSIYLHSPYCGNGKTSWALRLLKDYLNMV